MMKMKLIIQQLDQNFSINMLYYFIRFLSNNPNSKKIMENELNVIENLPIIDEEYNIAFIKDSKTNDYKHIGQILPNQFYILHCSNLISTELLEIIAYKRYTTRYPFADSLELRRRQQASLKQILKMLSYINFEVKDMIGVKYQV